jgi:hypothetical protein
VEYINLDRSFIPVKEGEEPRLGWTSEQGRRYGGWLDWQSLLKHQRVVLLAEAGCGKTTEFEQQAESLREAGQTAFFARVEQLEGGLEKALGKKKATEFQAWVGGDQPGYFFLDSVDEARLTQKRFNDALRRLADDIGDDALSRAHIFISCRPSDWRGEEDRRTFEKRLPPPKPTTAPIASPPPPAWAANRNMPAWKVALLAPLDEGYKPQQTKGKEQDQEKTPSALLIVNLAPLDDRQQRTFVQTFGIRDVDGFMKCLHSKQLEPLAERPRDLRSLADYWNRRGTLDSLSRMLDDAINLRLSEINPDRRSQDTLSEEMARRGAERLAAGLVLNQRFGLRVPAEYDGQALDAGSCDAADLLPDWSPFARRNLLARGLFAPASYGNIKFYNRLPMEYLAACWLNHLLNKHGKRQAVWRQLFVELNGVATCVPNLLPTAAWLSLKDNQVRAELLKRVPLALIQHGDPAALPLKDRTELLRIAARMHKDGTIADDGIDYRDLALFADPALAPVIREVWQKEPRHRFRFILLRLIREAAITECADIARDVALDDTADQHNRSVAVEALGAYDDEQIIEAVLPVLLAKAPTLSAQVATTVAESFFPKYMSVEQLLQLIDDTEPSKGVSGNFDYIIPDLLNACPDRATRLTLVAGICDLCLTPPVVDTYHRVGKKHRKIAQRLTPIARDLIRELQGEHHPALSAIMRVIRRSGQQDTIYEPKPSVSIGTVLNASPDLKQILFWEAATEVAEEIGPGHEPTAIFQIEQSFETGPSDLEHFLNAISSKPEEWQKRLALDAAVYILKSFGDLRKHASRLLKIVADYPVLKADLTRHLFPQAPKARFRRASELVVRRAKDERRNKSRHFASWVKFHGELSVQAQRLCSPTELSGWGQGASRLWNLTEWLGHHTRELTENAVLSWTALADAFGQPVADAYRQGMNILWRSNAPTRPDEKGRDKITCMGYAAVGMEAKDNPTWATALTMADAERAASYACLSGEGCPFWFDSLLNSHPAVVGPVLVAEIEREMRSTANTGRHFLSYYARVNRQPPAIVLSTIVPCLETAEPGILQAYDHALAILNAPAAILPSTDALLASTKDRLKSCTDDQLALRHLALLFTLASDDGITSMERWINAGPAKASERATLLFGELFNPHHAYIATPPLSTLSTTALEALLRLVYQYIRPEADNSHEGAYRPDARDNAESTRNNILRALLSRAGPEANASLLRVGDTLAIGSRLRFRELAHGKAERDSTPAPWLAAAVLAFEQQGLLPARNGDELLVLLLGILEDIQQELTTSDASPRAALRDCRGEDGVQGWLAYELKQRALGRYSVTQEPITDRRDRMDILVQATHAPDQVVIEVKHGAKRWTAQQLLNALELQLGQGYLRPDTRRHGILVVTNHRPQRRWQDPKSSNYINFSVLMELLKETATSLTRAQNHSRTLHAMGLDAAPVDPGSASGRAKPIKQSATLHTQSRKSIPRNRLPPPPRRLTPHRQPD